MLPVNQSIMSNKESRLSKQNLDVIYRKDSNANGFRAINQVFQSNNCDLKQLSFTENVLKSTYCRLEKCARGVDHPKLSLLSLNIEKNTSNPEEMNNILIKIAKNI